MKFTVMHRRIWVLTALTVLLTSFTGPRLAQAQTTTPSQTGDGSAMTITLDRQQYVAGQTARLQINVPTTLRQELFDYTFIRVRRAGSQEQGKWLPRCGWPLANGADQPCTWSVPAEPGAYEMYITGATTAYVNQVFARTTFRVVTTATAAKVAAIKFVRKTDKGVEPVTDKTLKDGDLVAVEATMDADTNPDDKQRNGKIAWGKGPNEEKQIDVYRESARIFRSKFFRIEVAPSVTKTSPSKVPSTKPLATEVSP